MNCSCGKLLYRRNKSGKCLPCLNADPAFNARRAEATRRAYEQHPEYRVKAGITRSATRLAHIPPEYRDDYRILIGKGVRAAEATRMILDHIERRAA